MTGPRGEPTMLSAGTQVVTTSDLRGPHGHVQVRGAVGVVLRSPVDATPSYAVRRRVDGFLRRARRPALAAALP